MTQSDYKAKIGKLIQKSRQAKGFTQAHLAEALNTSQSAINRIEKGGQNISLEMLARISDVLSKELVSLNTSDKINFRVNGGKSLSGNIEIKTSKNAAVGLLCASLLNKGKTTLRRVPRIEEVNRLLEVLTSIGVKTKWLNEQNDLEIIPPKRLNLENMDISAAKRTRSIIMFLGPLLHQYPDFKIPFAGGCSLGTRTVEPHMSGLRPFGLEVEATTNEYYHAVTTEKKIEKPIVLTERGNTVTENILMAAALYDGVTIIRQASNEYMIQDMCLFLEKLGVKIEGIGTNTLTVTGVRSINKDVEYYLSEDPIEAMSFIAAGIITNSEITIERAPIEFLDMEMAFLEEMGLNFEVGEEYKARNKHTRLVDITIKKSSLKAPKDKLHSYPSGVNMDNLPFLGLIATVAKGRTLVHDWSYENRAIYFTELTKLNATIELVDPHRVYITGPTKWRAADVVAPPALRPSVVVLLAMLATPGTSILRDVYSINRGYEDFATRLNSLGADIETLHEL